MTDPDTYGRHAAPEPYEVVPPGAVEPKTKAAAAAASAASVVTAFVLWALDALFWNGEAAPPVPLPVAMFVGLVIVGASTFLAGYFARHVNRWQP